MAAGEVLCKVGRVASLGLRRFVTSFTDRLCGVHWLALTVGNVSDIFPYFALCICFVYKPWTVGKRTGSLGFTAIALTLSPWKLQHAYERKNMVDAPTMPARRGAEHCIHRPNIKCVLFDYVVDYIGTKYTGIIIYILHFKGSRKPFGIQPHTAPYGTSSVTGNTALIKTVILKVPILVKWPIVPFLHAGYCHMILL